jgi:hypothetical protein
MGRRAFDKHFSENLHIHGLKCLGVTSVDVEVFREMFVECPSTHVGVVSANLAWVFDTKAAAGEG